MLGAADAGRTEADLARIAAGIGDQFTHALVARVRAGRQHKGKVHHGRQWREILHRLVRQLPVQRSRDRMPTGNQQQGVAIGCRLGDKVGSDIAARTGACLDQHRLPQALGQLGADHARHHIAIATGSKALDEIDRARGPGLGEQRVVPTQACQNDQRHQAQALPPRHPPRRPNIHQPVLHHVPPPGFTLLRTACELPCELRANQVRTTY